MPDFCSCEGFKRKIPSFPDPALSPEMTTGVSSYPGSVLPTSFSGHQKTAGHPEHNSPPPPESPWTQACALPHTCRIQVNFKIE